MDEIGLFPLGIVLMPAEQIPLHIFEPRYRELIGECLDQGREFGLVLADDEGLRAVGTRTAVTEVLGRFEDGRLDVVVEGRERFRLVQLTEGRSFHTGEVEPLADQDDPASPETVERVVTLFNRLVELTAAEVDPPDVSSPQLSFEIAGRFEFAPTVKQELLQSTSERLRLERLRELLEQTAQLVEHQHEIAGRAATNGKVDPGGP